MCEGWIKSYRSILEWEWWGDHNTTILWIYILHAVNYETRYWRGIKINPGELITSIASLAAKTRLSQRSIRTSLGKLQTTGELTIKTTNKYTLVTVRKWQDFQGETTSKSPTEATRETTTTKEVKNKRIKDIGEFVSELTPSINLQKAILDWVDMRNKNKKPPTEKAIQLAYAKVKSLASTEDEAVAIFNQSTLNNWSGVFPLKE